MEDILEIQNAHKAFNGVHAVNRCTFSIKRNKITGLIGPNGAGKTTMFNLISGLLEIDSGHIYFNDKDITKLSAYQRSHTGIGRSFQKIRLFPELTALENIVVAFPNNKESLMDSFKRYHPHQKSLQNKAMELLRSVNLEEKSNLKGYELSYGQKKLIEILRIKASNPDLILLDEPTAGINPTLIKEVTKIIKALQEEGKTIFIVEHNMPFIMNLCDHLIVMDQGTKLAEGKPKEIQNNKAVLEAYLGSKSDR